MNNNPCKHLEQQFNTIESLFKDNLIIHTIKPLINRNEFLYINQIEKNEERSAVSPKYFNYVHQYLAFIRDRSYHFLLKDFSIIRLHYKFDETKKLQTYNLLWFPCPFSIEFLKKFYESDREIIEDKFEVLNLFDSFNKKDNSFDYMDFKLRTPIRFDYDANYEGRKKDFHPLAHMHFQDAETRMINSKELCLYKFFSFILENCYPEYNYKNYQEGNRITKKMMRESHHWLKKGNIIDNNLGEKINSKYDMIY